MLSNTYKILNNYQFILSSSSPRRQQLLSDVGLQFDIVLKEMPEDYPENLPFLKIPEYLSQIKSQNIENDIQLLSYTKPTLIITADTMVICQNRILGKPKNAQECYDMLRFLSDKIHTVITGVTLRKDRETLTFNTQTTLEFGSLTDSEINYYIKTYKPYDKAGAYAIQEWIGLVGIKNINGCYYNVMGLPVHDLLINLLSFC